ncbi:unnamed protein product [Oikopleura dioica]|uniref:Uncharacterized protein n=1 Tax=Oikopleura dioica TaxID=34765 RepID=E4XIU9_OIKDI|nr:unnamed protein product [Oikopleura dioica]
MDSADPSFLLKPAISKVTSWLFFSKSRLKRTMFNKRSNAVFDRERCSEERACRRDMNYKQCLLKAVVPAEYNQEEQNYILSYLYRQYKNQAQRLNSPNLNVAQNLRVKGENRFVSGKLQWLSVLLSKIFRFPEIQFQHDIEAAPHCHFHFGKKLESICINVQHYSPIEVQQTIQQCSIPISIQQPVVYQIIDDNFRPNTNETVLYQVINQSAPIQTIQTPILPKLKQVYQLTHSQSSCSTPIALSPTNSGNSFPEIFNLQEEANMRYEKIASSWDQSTDDAWASIQYNKGTQSVGQKFICRNKHRQVILDNSQRYPDINCPERFSLHEFQNQPSIDDDIFATKIGKGIGLVNVKGQIFVDNLTKGSIFSQSWTGTEYVNKQYDANLHRSTIMEIKAGLVGVCVFDLEIFAKDLDVRQ